MSIIALNNRLDRLDDVGGDADLLAILDAAGERVKAWHESGNYAEHGPMPFKPLPELPPNATRRDREWRAKIEAARGRVERLDGGGTR